MPHNWGVQIIEGDEKNLEDLINGVVQVSGEGGGGELGKLMSNDEV